MTMRALKDHPLVNAVAEMTGLRYLTDEETRDFKTREDSDRFERETGRISEQADLVAIVNAAHVAIQNGARIIDADAIIPHLGRGHRQRLARIVRLSPLEIVVNDDGSFRTRASGRFPQTILDGRHGPA